MKGMNCFSGDSFVTTMRGQKRMDQVEVGEYVSDFSLYSPSLFPLSHRFSFLLVDLSIDMNKSKCSIIETKRQLCPSLNWRLKWEGRLLSLHSISFLSENAVLFKSQFSSSFNIGKRFPSDYLYPKKESKKRLHHLDLLIE